MASLQALLTFVALSEILFSLLVLASPQAPITHINEPFNSSPSLNLVNVPNVTAAGEPVLEGFVSFSIEFAFFPDFAGNKTHPNVFSNNLLEGLKEFQGSKPILRTGGNTQDYALFDPTLKTATKGIYTNVSNDYPRILFIGPSFFESYQTLSDVKFIHGFNLAKNDTEAADSLVNSVPYACKALSNGSFLYWEMGNEPDLFKTSAQGVMRPGSWTEADYIKEWNEKVENVKGALRTGCGDEWVSKEKFRWIAPSFAGTRNSLDALKSWNAGLNNSGIISKFSSHNYIGGATQPGVTLAGTLLNHTRTVSSIAAHNAIQKALASAGMKLPYILGETNSLYNQGAPGLSNSFGAALWGVDFNLMAAATNIKQVFMHQGTDYRYASWQPIETNKTTIGTKPPYYGNIAVAAALGNIIKSSVRVASIPLRDSTEAAYSIYTNDTLARLMIINLKQYNFTVASPSTRPSTTYNFTVPTSCAGTGTVQRLMANGSNAVTGITFNGMSWNYEVDGGKGSVLRNVTRDEMIYVGSSGEISIPVVDSSAALVQLTC